MDDQSKSEFLSIPNSTKRILALQNMKNNNIMIPLDLATCLLKLDLPTSELEIILSCTDSSNKIELEHFLTQGLTFWTQNVASRALWEWALRTDCLLWHRTIPLCQQKHIPQRVSYTLLDLAWYGAGENIISHFSESDGLEEMSPRFLALLTFRAMQWNIKSEKIIAMAEDRITKLDPSAISDDITLIYAASYLLRFAPEKILEHKIKWKPSGLWPDIIRSLALKDDSKISSELRKVLKKNSANSLQNVKKFWPELWTRHKLTTDMIQSALPLFAICDKDEQHQANSHWEFFGGIPAEKLKDAAIGIEDNFSFVKSISMLGNLLRTTNQEAITNEMIKRIQESPKPEEVLELIPQRYRISLNKNSNKDGIFARIFQEREKYFKDKETKAFSKLKLDSHTLSKEDESRKKFMELAYGEPDKNTSYNGNGFWDLLAQSWLKPNESQIEQLSYKARKTESIYRLCYIQCLGRFKGIDQAALKLLDFIRTEEEDILRSVVRALAGIGTKRAHQELVAFLTRPNVKFDIQMEIASLLKECDLSKLQSELRSAIEDLHIDPNTLNLQWELRESLTSLIQVSPNNTSNQEKDSLTETTTSELDNLLESKIPEYESLSSETKRALRTAQFFHLQILKSGNLNTIDLSPAIDMQYKALELAFRESFENDCNLLIKNGSLQRKLDLIGYARPIPAKMDEFERFIEALPVIAEVPFFSKFKLRKMLRAICQFRPGKRFTLDGLKAFALFFICFSRKECPYGLNDMFNISSINDAELATFCSQLHIFQDFRNRAAHEGFHPDASNDLDGIWKHTSNIIEFMFKIKSGIGEKQSEANKQTGRANALVSGQKVS